MNDMSSIILILVSILEVCKFRKFSRVKKILFFFIDIEKFWEQLIIFQVDILVFSQINSFQFEDSISFLFSNYSI